MEKYTPYEKRALRSAELLIALDFKFFLFSLVERHIKILNGNKAHYLDGPFCDTFFIL